MGNVAIVLAGGSGSRMKSSVKKQYLLIKERPVLYYSLEVFQCSGYIDEIVLVCGKGEIEQCRADIVQKYGFTKVTKIVEGGRERYHSVYEGLKVIEDCEYVLIHDGARPFVDEEMLERIMKELPLCKACVVGMPVKDTIKMSDSDGFVAQTPPREFLWTVQTPQSFSYSLIRGAYDRLAETKSAEVKITDDAMVAEYFAGAPVKLVEGSYKNIKITTPEDLLLAEMLLQKRETEGNCRNCSHQTKKLKKIKNSVDRKAEK